jgi:DNA-binding transcriptional ArsR family regulator
MSPESVTGIPEPAGTRILPFRGEEGRVPSPVLVRETLAAFGETPEVVRSATAIVLALGAPAEAPARAPGEAGLVAQLATETGLTAGEVASALRALREAALLVPREGGIRPEPDLFCTLPVLAGLDREYCREALERISGRVSPALAVLVAVARVSAAGRDGGGEWVQLSVQELAEETLYGRTAVTQAMGELASAGLLLRAEQPPRRGLRVRVAPRAMGQGGDGHVTGVRAGGRKTSPASAATSPVGGGVTVKVGGATIGVPAGSRLQLPPGLDYRLEIGLDGGAIIRIDD